MAEAAIESEVAVAVDMEVEGGVSAEAEVATANGGTKREREEEGEEGEEGNLKKAKVERSVEEERLEKDKNEEALGEDRGEEGEGEEEGEKGEIKEVKLGPKVFTSSLEMFEYFFKLLHNWGTKLDINQYEHMALRDLLKKGHSEPERKIGKGIEAFEVRYHPVFNSRCFFVRRIDGSSEDFSFRKCVDAIMPLPEEYQIKTDNDRSKGGRGGGGGRGGRGGRRGGRRGRGRGRG
ncbi:nuclear RNA polymerase D1A [Rhynchospora pubera]|uniref:Nuclear RNA polymerase D1A n=1 Tax=Rhynchospora pubera TaxID=906938 RepID=A0AAV8HS85_9POAL|nr:nuclear RNA polymerase D1A [Rhynchospora pubera]